MTSLPCMCPYSLHPSNTPELLFLKASGYNFTAEQAEPPAAGESWKGVQKVSWICKEVLKEPHEGVAFG